MNEISGFPFLHKAPLEGGSRTMLMCQNCGAEVIIEESLWINEYTNERHIWCQKCTTQVGMWTDAPPRSPQSPLPDST
jgi:hypothetical protein